MEIMNCIEAGKTPACNVFQIEKKKVEKKASSGFNK
jgi:hypothetical protein